MLRCSNFRALVCFKSIACNNGHGSVFRSSDFMIELYLVSPISFPF